MEKRGQAIIKEAKVKSMLIKETDRLLEDGHIQWDFKWRNPRWDIALFTFLLLLANVSLLSGSPAHNLTYNSTAVAAGQWWRLLSFPFAHVSFYNLLLDGCAFLMLYHGLEEENITRRIAYVTAAIAGSLIFPLCVSSLIREVGLCGLSGCAHGLMAITGLELMKRYPGEDMLNITGKVLFIVVLMKGIVEALKGQVMFSALHLGNVGIPVASSHLGGIIGGTLAFILINVKGGSVHET